MVAMIWLSLPKNWYTRLLIPKQTKLLSRLLTVRWLKMILIVIINGVRNLAQQFYGFPDFASLCNNNRNVSQGSESDHPFNYSIDFPLYTGLKEHPQENSSNNFLNMEK